MKAYKLILAIHLKKKNAVCIILLHKTEVEVNFPLYFVLGAEYLHFENEVNMLCLTSMAI